MDTYRIYEQFKEPFGEPAARALAETLGRMFEELRDTVTKEDFRILRESIDADVSRLDTALSGLAEAQARTEANVARLNTTVADLVIGQKQLFEAQARTEASLAHLDATVAKLTEAQTGMATALERLTIRTDDVVGRTFELQFRDRLTAYLGRFLRRGKLVPNDRLLDQIEPHLSDREVDDVLRADVIASGLVDGEPTHIVVEVSWTGDIDDIVRADERAKLLRRAGLPAIPLVACNAISPESTAFAKLRQVRIWLDGGLVSTSAN
jgi:serine/threonine protein phosphatase PrpC